MLMTVPLLAVLLVSGAFAVDLGMQRVARADMQALADVVALDLARELDGRTVNALVDVLEEKKERSLARNHDMVGSAKPDLAVTMGSSPRPASSPSCSAAHPRRCASSPGPG
ncbi:hypothetical protein [Nocardioides humi]|uniref:hypothetical protein n=1 Tax=Nocardioides humi TaxID=449461 RepID=UPI0011282FD4|nr:hypothetical protein [Nocardioides humi]